jgi:uncharacterized membrane protein
MILAAVQPPLPRSCSLLLLADGAMGGTLKAKHLAAIAVLTPLYWAVAISVVALVVDGLVTCTRGSQAGPTCSKAAITIPVVFLVFAYLYAWMIWVTSRRAERDNAEASRLSVSALGVAEPDD